MWDKYKKLYPFIKITFLDGIRNKVAIGVIVFSVVSSIANLIIIKLAAQDVGKVAIDFALSSFSLIGLFLILFACGSSIYRDIDRKTISLVLSKAISRKEYIVGRFLGYLTTIFFVSFISFLIGLITLFFIKITHPTHFTAPFLGILLAYLSSFLGFMVLLSVLILFSSLTTSSFTAMLLTAMVYFIGNSIGDLRDFSESQASEVAGVTPFFRILIRIVHFIMPDLSKFDLKIFAANGLEISLTFVLYSLSYAVVYSLIMLLLAMKAFEKREFV